MESSSAFLASGFCHDYDCGLKSESVSEMICSSESASGSRSACESPISFHFCGVETATDSWIWRCFYELETLSSGHPT